MYRILYKVLDAQMRSVGALEVDTTRPETVPGDTAVAVHPEDTRYIMFHGCKVENPITGKLMPLVCDSEFVNRSLGSGCVKITPSHSLADFEFAKKHCLEFADIYDDACSYTGTASVPSLTVCIIRTFKIVWVIFYLA